MPWVPGLALDGDFGWSVALATLNSPWWMVDGSKQQCDKPNIVTNPKITMNCWYPCGRCGIGLPLLKSIPKCAELAFRDEIGPVFYACSVYAYGFEEICVPMKHGNVKTHLPSGKHGIPNKMMANFRWDPQNSSKFLWWLSPITHTLW